MKRKFTIVSQSPEGSSADFHKLNAFITSVTQVWCSPPVKTLG